MKNTMNRLLKGAVVITLMTVLAYPVFAAEPRDNDANAIVYGGAYSVAELNSKLINGSGPNPTGGVYGNYQTPNGVRTFYHGVGIREEQWGVQSNGVQNLTDGDVTKNGEVIVRGAVVARNIYSAGRVSMGASTRDSRFAFPIYWRTPINSMGSNSLPAFVYLNSDGTFGYAIIKSCGNPVLDSDFTANVKAIPPVPPAEAPKTFNVTVNKFNDIDEDGSKDAGETMLSGWQFKLEGGGVERFGVTDAEGKTTFSSLPIGNYKVTETLTEGWRNTTLNPINITLSDANLTIWFGNVKNAEVIPMEKPTPEREINSVLGAKVQNDQAVKGAFTGAMPKAGAEEATMAFSLTSLSAGAYYWYRSKKTLLNVLKS